VRGHEHQGRRRLNAALPVWVWCTGTGSPPSGLGCLAHPDKPDQFEVRNYTEPDARLRISSSSVLGPIRQRAWR